MAVNSLSLVMMVFSYAVIIYKVRESGKAMAKYQLTIRTRVGSQKVCCFLFFLSLSLQLYFTIRCLSLFEVILYLQIE